MAAPSGAAAIATAAHYVLIEAWIIPGDALGSLCFLKLPLGGGINCP
jgi:hypothetical protein